MRYFDEYCEIHLDPNIAPYTWVFRTNEKICIRFGVHLSKILYLKLEKQFHCIKPFLIMLNALPEVIYNVGNYNKVYTDEIPMDLNIIKALRKINNGY